MAPVQNIRSSAFLWIVCVFFLAIWQVLLWAQNFGLASDDSGEMVTAAFTLGLAHPPGYPLWTLIGRLFCLLPLGSVAFRLNLLSEFFTLFALVFFAQAGWSYLRTSSKEEQSPALTLVKIGLAVLGLLFCPFVFAQSLTAKGGVYTLTLLFLCLFWYLRLEDKGKRSLDVLLFVFIWAVGLTNHWETEILWLPFLIYWIVTRVGDWSWKRSLQCLSLFFVGISVYLYLPLRAIQKPLFCWGNPIQLHEFWWDVSRKLATGSESLFRPFSVDALFFCEYLKTLSQPIFGLILFGFLWGGYELFRRHRSLFYSSAIFYVPMILAVLMIPREETLFLLGVYLVPSEALVVFGCLAVLERAQGVRANWLFGFLGVLIIGWGFLGCGAGPFGVSNVRQNLSLDFGNNVLRSLPANAIFLSESDNYVMPILYEKNVKGLRKDVVFETSVFLFHSWGWEQLADQDDQVAQIVRSKSELEARLNALAGLRRPLFYDLDQAYWRPALKGMKGTWIPSGLVDRWEPQEPSSHSVFREVVLAAKNEKIDPVAIMESAWLSENDPPTAEIGHYYANQFFGAARWLREHGDIENAYLLFDRGLALNTVAGYAYSETGLMAAQDGYLRLAKELFRHGIENDPDYFPNYVNLAHVYWLLGTPDKGLEVYQKAFRQVKGEHVDQFFAEYQKTINSPRPYGVEDRTPREYLRLKKKFRDERAFELSGLIDERMSPKSP